MYRKEMSRESTKNTESTESIAKIYPFAVFYNNITDQAIIK